MSNIDNLKNKILEEAKIKENSILEKGKEEATRIIENKILEAKLMEKDLMEKARLEAISKKERIVSNTELKIRNEKLEAKQFVIEEVFSEALIKLQSLSKEEYINFFIQKISSLNINGDERIIINIKDKEIISEEVLKAINENLIKRGKLGKLTLCDETKKIAGGFIIEKNGIEINSTFEALISSMKEDLEYEVAGVLFN